MVLSSILRLVWVVGNLVSNSQEKEGREEGGEGRRRKKRKVRLWPWWHGPFPRLPCFKHLTSVGRHTSRAPEQWSVSVTTVFLLSPLEKSQVLGTWNHVSRFHIAFTIHR